MTSESTTAASLWKAPSPRARSSPRLLASVARRSASNALCFSSAFSQQRASDTHTPTLVSAARLAATASTSCLSSASFTASAARTDDVHSAAKALRDSISARTAACAAAEVAFASAIIAAACTGSTSAFGSTTGSAGASVCASASDVSFVGTSYLRAGLGAFFSFVSGAIVDCAVASSASRWATSSALAETKSFACASASAAHCLKCASSCSASRRRL
mmetsp:Transcript_14675/g.61940  ORF Transcript_14675/g.61940 Transcript_14675/m.61940 type:complete len:218 (-) Transcript_14675:481-1134(-)